jgi:hypothetical protein
LSLALDCQISAFSRKFEEIPEHIEALVDLMDVRVEQDQVQVRDNSDEVPTLPIVMSRLCTR